MSGKGGRNRDRKLSAEDRALWDAFSRAVTPSDAKKRVPEKGNRSGLNSDSRETFGPNRPAKPTGTARPVSAPPPKGKPSSAKPPPDVATFDRNTARKLARGRMEIEARIDLHGLRQAEARVALRGFLNRAAQSGFKTVLVITGKGGDDAEDHWDPGRERSGRGILRRNVPMWLSGPEFRDLVASFTTAHLRHGGDGAFYVQVRSRRRGGA